MQKNLKNQIVYDLSPRIALAQSFAYEAESDDHDLNHHFAWQGRYIPPKRRQMGGRLLDRACAKLNKRVASELKHSSSRTLELDGWDSASLQQLVNFMLSTFDSEEFLGDRDLTGLGKSAADMTKLVIEVIELVELRYPPSDDTDLVVHGLVTDNPTVMRQIRAQVKERRKRKGHRLQIYSCWLHAISKILEDIFKIPFFASLLAKHKLLTNKVRKKQFLHAEVGKAQQMVQFRDQFADKLGRWQVVSTKRVGATRMGLAYPCMKRNKKLEQVFSFVASLPSFDKNVVFRKRTAFCLPHTSLQLHSNKKWVTSPSVKMFFMDSQSLSQSLKRVKDDSHFVMTANFIFWKKNTANCYGKMSGTHISAQTAVWFGKLMLPRKTRYWYQRGHGGAPGVLRFALRQLYSCEPAASIFECLGSQNACRMCQSPPVASNGIVLGLMMPTVQLDAKAVLLSTYIYLENAAKLAAIYSHLGLPLST